MAFLLPLLARWGVPQRFQRLAAYIALAVGFLALCGLLAALILFAVHRHDKQVVENHDAKQAAQVTQTELNAERTAEANDAVRRETREAQAKDLNDARDAAPAGADAGPKTRAVLNKLREQQAKGR